MSLNPADQNRQKMAGEICLADSYFQNTEKFACLKVAYLIDSKAKQIFNITNKK